MRKLPTDNSIPTKYSQECRTGIARRGVAVSCSNETGVVCEGNVEMILPWGAEWFDREWDQATIVVRDHEDGHLSNWNPANVDVL